jgi:hypothetical protein
MMPFIVEWLTSLGVNFDRPRTGPHFHMPAGLGSGPTPSKTSLAWRLKCPV